MFRRRPSKEMLLGRAGCYMDMAVWLVGVDEVDATGNFAQSSSPFAAYCFVVGMELESKSVFNLHCSYSCSVPVCTW